jgi:glycosyltransferase involved in cell wall biosynthesis
VALARELGIADRVEFTGELPHEQVLLETSRSDVYMGLFSGRYTGLGTAAIESMLMGVPAVVNVPPGLFGGLRLTDMEDYVHADTNDLETVTGRTALLLERQELRERIGAGGRRFVAENLGWDKIARSLEEVLAELQKRRR